MTNPNDNNNTALAGAHCPECQEVCVYEVSDELARSGIDTIQIACHACHHVFKTTLPDDKRLPPLEDNKAIAPMDDAPLDDASSDNASSGAIEHYEEDELMMLPSGPQKSGLMKYVLIATGAGVILLGIGAVAMIVASNNMRENSLAELEALAPKEQVIPAPSSAPAVAPAQQNDGQDDGQGEGGATPEPLPVTEVAPVQNIDQFEVSDRGYTLSKSDLGTVMNIKVSVLNNGDTAAKPNKMVLHLMSQDGVILMTWPMVSGSANNRDLIPPRSSRQYSAQLIEPPEDAKILEVEIQ